MDTVSTSVLLRCFDRPASILKCRFNTPFRNDAEVRGVDFDLCLTPVRPSENEKGLASTLDDLSKLNRETIVALDNDECF
jgi:hypothetical protein